jgi:hypothetical protein
VTGKGKDVQNANVIWSAVGVQKKVNMVSVTSARQTKEASVQQKVCMVSAESTHNRESIPKES